MKKFVLLLATGAIMAFTGCASDSDTSTDIATTAAPTTVAATEAPTAAPATEAPTEPQVVPAPEGFVRYVSEAYGFSVYHPDYWVSSDGIMAAMLDATVREWMVESLGEDVFGLLMEQDVDDSLVAVQWFDPAGIVNDFMANVNIVVSDASGLTQEMLQDSLVQAMFAAMYDEMFGSIFSKFERSDISGEILGGNYFVFFEADVGMFDTEWTMVQFMTVIADYSFVITFSTPPGQADLNTARAVLATLAVE